MHVRVSALVLSAMLLSASAAQALDPKRAPSGYGRAIWAEHNGLAFGTINAIAQDRDGYLWLGTDNGLIRFDGTAFVRWPLTGEPSPFHAAVHALLAARDGSLWIGGVGGLGRMRDGVVSIYALPGGSSMDGVANMAEEPDGTLWVGGRGVLKLVNDTWQTVGPADGLPGGGATALYADPRGNVWVSTLRGTFRRSKGSTRFERITNYSVGSFSMDRASEDSKLADFRRTVRRQWRCLRERSCLLSRLSPPIARAACGSVNLFKAW